MILEAEIFKLYVLVLARFTGLMVSAPVLGSANFPSVAKAGLAGLCAIIVTPTIRALAQPLPASPLALAGMAAEEVLIGLALGFIASLVFAAVQVAGQILDMQSGFGMMNVFNPAIESQVPIFGFFLFILAVLYMLVLNLHHVLIYGLVASFQHIPPGGLELRQPLMMQAATWGRDMFVDGVMIAAPIAVALLLAYITFGLLGRVVPQLHLFVVGFPVTIALSLFLMAFMIEVYLLYLDGMFERMFQHVDVFMRGLG